MVVGRKAQNWHKKLQFTINGENIVFVIEYSYLGHLITYNLNEKYEIHNSHNSLCGKFNNVICSFKNCDPIVQIKLLTHYYGILIFMVVCCGKVR